MAEERGITSLDQFYPSEIKYDLDDFAEVSARIQALMSEQHFLP